MLFVKGDEKVLRGDEPAFGPSYYRQQGSKLMRVFDWLKIRGRVKDFKV